jgi:hypothetical protein
MNKPQFQSTQPQPPHQPSQQSPQQQSPQSNNRNLPIDTAKLIDSTLQNMNSSHLRNNFNEKRLLVKLLKATNLSSRHYCILINITIKIEIILF